LAALLVLLFSSFPVKAAEELDGSLDLQGLIEEAIEVNPEILATKNRWESARNIPSQAGSLPDPVLMLGIRNVGFNEITRGEEMMSMATLSIGQSIPFPGKLGKKEEIAHRNADRVGENYHATVNSVIARLKAAYFDYYFIERSVDLIQENKILLEKFEQTARTKYEVGDGIQQDILKAQVEVLRMMERLKIKEQERVEVVARINKFLDRPPSSPLPPPDVLGKSSFELDLQELNRLALENSPSLKRELHAVERDRTALSLSRREYLPDLSISAGIADRGELDDIWELRLGINVPFYFWKKQSRGVKEASYNLEASNHGYQAAREDLLYRIKDIYELTKMSGELVVLYEEGILPRARLSLESAVAGYEVGRVDFLTLLDSFTKLLEDELKYARELTRFEKSISRLEEATGVRFTGL
jgi:outer membrane protein TolC